MAAEENIRENLKSEMPDGPDELSVLESGKMVLLEKENALYKSISAAESLNEIFSEIVDFAEDRWGFNLSGVQLVDSSKRFLKFYKNYSKIFSEQILNSVANDDVPFNSESSVSALVANNKKWIYVDYDELDEKYLTSELDKKAIEIFDIKQNLIVPVIESKSTIAVIHLISSGQKIDVSKNVINEVLSFVEGIAPLIQIAKRRDELDDLEKIKNKKLKILTEITSITEMPELLDSFSDLIEEMKYFDAMVFNVLDGDNTTYCCEKVILPWKLNALEEVILGMTFPFLPKALENLCFSMKAPCYFNEDEQHQCSDVIAGRIARISMQHMVVIPVFYKGFGIGTVMLFKKEEEFDPYQIKKAEDLITAFAGSIESCRSYQHLKKREDVIARHEKDRKKFLEFIERVNEITSNEKIVYNIISSEFLSFFDFDMVTIHLIEDDLLVIKNIAVENQEYQELSDSVWDFYSEYSYELNAEDGVQIIPIVNGEPLLISDVEKVKHLPMSPKDTLGRTVFGKLRTALHVPIKFGNLSIGVISLWSLKGVVELSKGDVEFLTEVCSFLGSSINNAKLYSTVEEQKNEIETTMLKLEAAQEELKKAKDIAEASTQAKSDFLANMSHEIRTPMNAIINLSGLSLRTDLSNKQRDYISKIKQSSESLLGIINDILDLSKIEANKVDLEIVDFDIHDVVSEVIDIVSDKSYQKGIDFIAEGFDQFPYYIKGDPLRLKQILINLSNNAMKFTEDGYVKIKFDYEVEEDDKLRLKFIVEDTGVGIPEDKLDALFESFTQADSSTTRKYGGTGLGLSISKHLCQLMDGSISIKSKLGEGSSFIFDVVVAKGENKESKAKFISINGKKILLLSENQNLNKYINDMLNKCGLFVDILNKIENIENRYDLIIFDESIDEELEGFGGEKLASISDNKNHIYLHSLNRNDIETMPELGVTFSKPIKPEEFIRAIYQSLSGKKVMLEKPKRRAEDFEAYYIPKIGGAKVLVVEDNIINQQIAKELLQLVGVNVEVVSSGKIAINKLEDNGYDVIFTDIEMPDMDGYTLTSMIREMDVEKDIPIIAMTAHAMSGFKEKCLNKGMNDYIPKPINQKFLYEVLAKWVDEEKVKSRTTIAQPVINGEETEDRRVCPLTNIELISDIDPQRALRLMGNSKGVFYNVLKLFADNYKDFSKHISELIHEQSPESLEEARVAAHTLKGAAGSVSSKELVSISERLEKLILIILNSNEVSGEEIPVEEIIAQLESQLSSVVQDINKILDSL